MTEPRMPTSLPSPVDRRDFRFFAVDAQGDVWQWKDDEAIWVRVPPEAVVLGGEAECGVVH